MNKITEEQEGIRPFYHSEALFSVGIYLNYSIWRKAFENEA